MAQRRRIRARPSQGSTHIGEEKGINLINVTIVDIGSGNGKGALTFMKMARTPMAPTVPLKAGLGQGRTPIVGERHIIDIITYRNDTKGDEMMLMKKVDTMGEVMMIGETMNITQRSLALTSPEPLRRRRRACIPVAQKAWRKPHVYKGSVRIGRRPNTHIIFFAIMPTREGTSEHGPQRPMRRQIKPRATLELLRLGHQRRELRPLTKRPDR